MHGRMERFRGQTNAFSTGSGSAALVIPKKIAEELEIDTTNKKTYFNIYTEITGKKKRIVYEFFDHAEKGDKSED
jgi:hypothetical protein